MKGASGCVDSGSLTAFVVIEGAVLPAATDRLYFKFSKFLISFFWKLYGENLRFSGGK